MTKQLIFPLLIALALIGCTGKNMPLVTDSLVGMWVNDEIPTDSFGYCLEIIDLHTTTVGGIYRTKPMEPKFRNGNLILPTGMQFQQTDFGDWSFNEKTTMLTIGNSTKTRRIKIHSITDKQMIINNDFSDKAKYVKIRGIVYE